MDISNFNYLKCVIFYSKSNQKVQIFLLLTVECHIKFIVKWTLIKMDMLNVGYVPCVYVYAYVTMA
jgi:hypothetical protein